MELAQTILISFASETAAFVVGLADGSLYGGSVRGDEPLHEYRGLTGAVRFADASPSQKQMVATAHDGRALIWDWPGGRLRTIIPHARGLKSCGVVSPGRYVTVDEHRTGRIFEWEPPQKRESKVVVIEGKENDVDDFAVNRVRNEIVFRRNTAWAVWDTEAGHVREVFRRMPKHEMDYMDGEFAISRNGEFFLIYWDQGQLFRASNGDLVSTFERNLSPDVVKISDDGNRLAFGTFSGEIIVRDDAGQELLNVKQGDDPLLHLDLSPDGSYVSFVASEGRYGIIEIATRQLVLTPESLQRRINAQ